jgi:hypothetical protein
MALSDSQKADILFKKSQNKSDSLTTRQFFEEPFPGRPVVLPSQLWAQESLIPSTAPGGVDAAITGVVQRFIDKVLTSVPGTNGSFYHADLIDTISFDYGDGSYNYVLKDASNNAIAFGQGDWLLDPSAGVLTFFGTLPSGVSSGTPPKISFYKYVGTKGFGSTSGTPTWAKYTVSHVALQTAALTNNVTLLTLGAKDVVHGIVIKHSTAFAGTSITSYALSVGITGALDKYVGYFDGFQAVSDTAALSVTLGPTVESFSGSTAIKIAATSEGANLSASTAGSVDVWVLKSTLP